MYRKERFSAYQNGQLGIMTPEVGLQRGQISSIAVEDQLLTICFHWLAQADEGEWHLLPNKPCEIDLSKYRDFDMSGGRLLLAPADITGDEGERFNFYPENDTSNVDPDSLTQPDKPAKAE
jgi:hypothetical protein